MRYDHCRFCGKTVRLAELHVSCPACLEKIELELLKRAYWVIHGSGSEFVRPEQVISRVMAVRDQKLDLSLLRYWVLRGHLKTDVFGRIGVPAEEDILEDAAESGLNLHLLRRIRGEAAAMPGFAAEIPLELSPSSREKRKRAVA